MPEIFFELDTIAKLERVLGQLPDLIEEIFERRLLEGMLGETDEVSSAQLRTLRFLAGLAGGNAGFPVGQIATGLRISYPAATKAVDRLTERLLAERHRDDGDARTIRVRLTSKGRELVERLVFERRAALTRVLDKLGGESEAQVVLRWLEVFIVQSRQEFQVDSDTALSTDSDTEIGTDSDTEIGTDSDTA
jgi:DNA-binding MarR family transcriptional regulator